MILYIDVTQEKAVLALVGLRQTVKLTFQTKRLSESLLVKIENLLDKAKLNKQEITKIVTKTGPGPFSRLRTAVVTTNAIAYALKIPVSAAVVDNVDLDFHKFKKLPEQKSLLPFYDRNPNITFKRKTA